MEYYSSNQIGRTFILKLVQGDYIKESIEELVQREHIENAYIVTGIATLDRSRLHMISTTDYPMDVSVIGMMDTPLEVISMDGLIIDGMVYLHMCVSDRECADPVEQLKYVSEDDRIQLAFLDTKLSCPHCGRSIG